MFQTGMPTKVTLELIINDRAFYESETNENVFY